MAAGGGDDRIVGGTPAAAVVVGGSGGIGKDFSPLFALSNPRREGNTPN